MTKDNVPYRNMVEALRLMAAPAETQARLLPSYVPVADEMALVFEDAHALVAHLDDLLSTEQLGDLAKINDKLVEMSSATDRDLWSCNALYLAPEWEYLRESASRLLESMGEAVMPPAELRGEYVRG